MFIAFGVMNPLIAKLTPLMLDMFAESLAETGFIIEEQFVDASTSWTQFFKNMPIAMIVFTVLFGGTVTGEYNKATLILIVSRGLERYKILLSKIIIMLSVWTIGYWLSFAITYGINDMFWTNITLPGIMDACLLWWIFGIWVIGLISLFSSFARNTAVVLLGTGGAVVLSYAIGIIPKVGKIMPAMLINSSGLMLGTQSLNYFYPSCLVTGVTFIIMIAFSITLFNKREL